VKLRRLCVFCGSSSGARADYRDAARRLGRLLARESIGLVYRGGNVGLMGVVADAALTAGGHVIGVIPQNLVDREIAHHGVTELRVVGSMHERKALMADLVDAFIALPGGYGTFEELWEAVTWNQLGLHRKPCGLLNVAGFYDPFLAQVDRAIADGFVKPENRALITSSHSEDELLLLLRTGPPPSVRS
jgi:uncharacterized protein (TIGR00730 family)